MNHAQKTKLARRMCNSKERKSGKSIWDSFLWIERSAARAAKVEKIMAAAKIRREKRRKERAKAHKALLKAQAK